MATPRVSRLEQDLTIQCSVLKVAGCRMSCAEKDNNSWRKGGSKLQVLLDVVRPGDALMVTRIWLTARLMTAST
jgi:hypothetical protein